MATSYTRLIRAGLMTIANADATLRTLCDRTTRIMVPWGTIGSAQKPVLAVMVANNGRIGGDGDKRRVLALIGAFAEGNGAQAKVEDMVQRVREITTPGAFAALTPTMDCAVWEATDRDPGDEGVASDEPTLLARADLDLVIIGNAPQ